MASPMLRYLGGTMRAAFSTWNERIAPVFDTAPRVAVVDSESGRLAGWAEETLPADLPVQKVMRLAELGVETLVCGAVSWPLRAMLANSGIEVISFVAGDLDEVVNAWLTGRVRRGALAMPGCRGRPDRPRHGGRRGQAGGAAGVCACPACGHRLPHERGVSCGQRSCPVCGVRMVREP